MALNFRNSNIPGLRPTVEDPRGPYAPGQEVAAPWTSVTGAPVKRAGVNPFWNALESMPGPQNPLINWARQGLNFFRDIGDWGSQDRVGTGFGDQIFGVQPDYYVRKNAESAGRRVGNFMGSGILGLLSSRPQDQGPQLPETQLPMDLQSALAMAQEILGGPNTVSYDPLRQSARSQAADYDARVEAMYNQLANSIRADAPTIRANYQQSIDASEGRAADTQQAIQSSSDAAAAKNLETLQALGLGEAAGNIVAQGQDLNTATSRAVADSAARQQIVGDQLGQRQQTSLDYNTNIAGVAGLEGAEQRNRIQHELARLLAQYDVAEQQANQNARQSFLSQQLGLAQALTGDAWQRQGYQDDLMRWLYEQQAAAAANQAPAVNQNVIDMINQLLSREENPMSLDDVFKYSQSAKNLNSLWG